jgi:excinuclease ABC subunit C
LFEHPKPLLERFGKEFFRSVPKKPGIYVMCGASGQILYVGQSSNLRTRLGSYRNANPDHLSRRVIRLIHQVATVTWEECDSAALARVRENELLRLHRPKFNRMNVYPRAYWFISVDSNGNGLAFRRTNIPETQTGLFGAFKGAAVYGFGSLLRLLWTVVHRPISPFDLPRQLVRMKPPVQFTIPFTERAAGLDRVELIELVSAYFAGESPRIIEWLSQALHGVGKNSLFYQNLIRDDLDTLAGFFENGPARNWRLKEQNAIHDRLILQEDLDDWIALSGFQRNETVRKSGLFGSTDASLV